MTFYNQISANKRKTWLIMAIFITFVALVAYIFGQASGYGASWVGIALIFAGLSGFASYYYGDKLILAISGARPADKKQNFQFYTVCENLAIGSAMPMPKLYVIEDSAPNAFATGRDPDHAVVCATTGLLAKLDRSELEGVIAHELSHIRNYDIRLMSIVTILVGVITLLADWFMRHLWWGRGQDSREEKGSLGAILSFTAIILAFLSPLIATLIKLAISRSREFLADASAAQLTRYPQGLARALEKISADKEPLEAANKATAHLYIINPLKNTHEGIGWFAGLFNTHPSVGERIKRLQEM